MKHQLHGVGGGEAEAEEATAPSAGREEDEEWVQQANWSRIARGRRQVLEDDQGPGDAPVVGKAGACWKSGEDTCTGGEGCC